MLEISSEYCQPETVLGSSVFERKTDYGHAQSLAFASNSSLHLAFFSKKILIIDDIAMFSKCLFISSALDLDFEGYISVYVKLADDARKLFSPFFFLSSSATLLEISQQQYEEYIGYEKQLDLEDLQYYMGILKKPSADRTDTGSR